MADHIPRNGTKPDSGTMARPALADAVAMKAEKVRQRKKPDPNRMAVLRSLPPEIKLSLTKEEAEALLYEDIWPDSLLLKLKDFLVEEIKH